MNKLSKNTDTFFHNYHHQNVSGHNTGNNFFSPSTLSLSPSLFFCFCTYFFFFFPPFPLSPFVFFLFLFLIIIIPPPPSFFLLVSHVFLSYSLFSYENRMLISWDEGSQTLHKDGDQNFYQPELKDSRQDIHKVHID